jgi:hypothetical protein
MIAAAGPSSYTLGAPIAASKLMGTFNPKTKEDAFIAYQVSQDAWRIGCFKGVKGIVFEIQTQPDVATTLAAAANLRNIKPGVVVHGSAAKPLDK